MPPPERSHLPVGLDIPVRFAHYPTSPHDSTAYLNEARGNFRYAIMDYHGRAHAWASSELFAGLTTIALNREAHVEALIEAVSKVLEAHDERQEYGQLEARIFEMATALDSVYRAAAAAAELAAAAGAAAVAPAAGDR